MAISELDHQVIDIYARHIAAAWPPVSQARRDRLAVLFSGPWLDDEPDDRWPGSRSESSRLPAAS